MPKPPETLFRAAIADLVEEANLKLLQARRGGDESAIALAQEALDKARALQRTA